MVISAIPPVTTGVSTAESRRFEFPARYDIYQQKRLASLGFDRAGRLLSHAQENKYPSFIPAGFASTALLTQNTINALYANTVTFNFFPVQPNSLYSPFFPLSSVSPFFGDLYQASILNTNLRAVGKLLDILA